MKIRKIELENKIFAYAAYLKTPVYGVQGVLRVFGKNPYLRALTDVYNLFFAEENKAFCASEKEPDWQALFERQRVYLPLLKKPQGVPFLKIDFLSEFAYLIGKKYEGN